MIYDQNADTLTEAGAHRLAASIVAYWAAQGRTVKAYVEKFTVANGKRTPDAEGRLTYYSVRSDMVNGLPA